MFMLLIFTVTLSLTLIILINLIPMINIHKKLDREKNSPFECGFDPFSSKRMPFSIQFFTISLMFLIFDIEITLILPLPMLTNQINVIQWILSSMFLLTILITSLLIEWKEGSMNWK